MRTAARKRTSKPRTRQRGLFDKEEVTIKRTWRQPKIDRQADARWIFAWVDPQQLGVEVVIPEWMTRLGERRA
jgi:hypothetical protein